MSNELHNCIKCKLLITGEIAYCLECYENFLTPQDIKEGFESLRNMDNWDLDE